MAFVEKMNTDLVLHCTFIIYKIISKVILKILGDLQRKCKY